MSPDDWESGDPWVDPADPEAAERERRRVERETKRRLKGQKKAARAERRAGTEPASPVEPEAPAASPADPAPSPVPDPAAASPTREEPAPPAPPAAPPARTPLPADAPLPGSTRKSDDALPFEENFWGEPQPEKEKHRRRSGTRGGRARRPLAIALALLAVALLMLANLLFQPFHGDGSGRVTVRIPKGASVGDIGDILDKSGVVSSSALFQLRATLAGKRSEFLPGRKRLVRDMSYGDAISALTKAPAAAASATHTFDVTIPEGLSRPQAAPLLADAGVKGNYLAETKKVAGFDPDRFGAQGRAKDLEGFLFPATYELPAKGTVHELVQRQLDAFEERIGSVDLSFAKKKNLTIYDVLTIASMIEDEAGPADFRNVSSVIYNRLKRGIPLGIDATVRFAVDNYTSPLKQSELASDSPYNTRVKSGLPPGPIASPGLAAIQAAANPAHNDYLYYVTDAGSCNRLAFSSTDAQFQQDVSRYDDARAANGGNSPTQC